MDEKIEFLKSCKIDQIVKFGLTSGSFITGWINTIYDAEKDCIGITTSEPITKGSYKRNNQIIYSKDIITWEKLKSI